MKFPYVDYISHPAFAPYVRDRGFDDTLIGAEVAAVDRLNAAFVALDQPVPSDVTDTLQTMHDSMERISRHVYGCDISLIAYEWLHTCLQWVLDDLHYEYIRLTLLDKRNVRELDGVRSSQLAAMREQGMYVVDLPSDSYGEIRRLALEYLPTLKQKALANPGQRAVTNLGILDPLGRAIKRAAIKAGILDVLSAYKGNTMTMLGAGLEYSCAEQSWYQNLYADIGLSDSPMQYLHMDEADHLPKSMIYVTPVTADNGPTRALPGSNMWEVSEFRLRMFKALDRVTSDRYAVHARGSHYRSLFRHPELRQQFMELPRAFQGSSHFGDDVLDGSPLAETLMSHETPFISDGGQALVFDGPRLLHRGSLVKFGERLALQVVYRNRNDERIRSAVAGESYLQEQLKLIRKYAFKLAKSYA